MDSTYHQQHQFCPSCGGDEILSTCVGWGGSKDLNKAICPCGWEGIVHDLKPPPALELVRLERQRQDEKWGEQNHPDFVELPHPEHIMPFPSQRAALHGFENCPTAYRASCDKAAEEGRLSFMHILMEEVAELCLATTPEELKGELIQVAAVAVSWVEAIDRRGDER